MSNVKLAVRVRPMSAREKEQKKSSIVKVENDHTIAVTNLKVGVCGAGDSRTRVRRYTADYCLDSSLPASHPNHATQQMVFNSVGTPALNALRANRGVCILAYGQSASGKTHTVLGAGGIEGGGLVPRLCDAIADREWRQFSNDAGLDKTEDNNVEVFVSYFEIYNEKVRDLLAEENEGNKDLHGREHPRRGPYVQNAVVISVRGREALRALVLRGTRARRAAPTSRNAASSRSHAVLSVARSRGPGAPVLHAVDLAGSEKASPFGAALSRQKEGANINRSLVALGNVIAALASGGRRGGSVGAGRGGGAYVPYRGSALTWILKDSFGAGAITFMIATVSPSSCCYSETVNTLRWAARARLIPAALVCAPARVPALRAQLDDIRGALQRAGIRYIPESKSLILNKHEIFNQFTTTLNQACTELRVMDASVQNLQEGVDYIHEQTLTATTDSSDRIAGGEKPSELKVNELFGPCLGRSGSGHDLVTVSPKKNQKRHYNSEEVLSLSNKVEKDESQYTSNESISTSSTQASVNRTMDKRSKGQDDSSEKEMLNINQRNGCSNAPVAYQIENRRAEIVDSVTKRLYTKNKMKDELNSPKSEVKVGKKATEPLSELKICSNARQRLLEVSQRVLRTRRKIGIPAYTQTMSNVVRMKEAAIDVQGDLEPFHAHNDNTVKLYRNVACGTYPMTPRSKEASVGTESGSIHISDKCIETEHRVNTTKFGITKSCGVMTDDFVNKSNASTQTHLISLRNPNIYSFTKYLNPNYDNLDDINNDIPTIVNINISHQLYPNDTDEISDDSIDNVPTIAPPNCNTTPDLLSHHNSTEHDTVASTILRPPKKSAIDTEKNSSNISSRGENENISQCFRRSLENKELTGGAKHRNNKERAMQYKCSMQTSCYDNKQTAIENDRGQGGVDRVSSRDNLSGRTVAPERTRIARTVPSPQPSHTLQHTLTDLLTHDSIEQCSTSNSAEIIDNGTTTSLSAAYTNSHKSSDKFMYMMENHNSILPYNLETPLKERATNKCFKKLVSFNDKNKVNPKSKQGQESIELLDEHSFFDEVVSKIKLHKPQLNTDKDAIYKSKLDSKNVETKSFDLLSNEFDGNRSHVTMFRSPKPIYSQPIKLAMDKTALTETKYRPVYRERSVRHEKLPFRIAEPTVSAVSDHNDNVSIKSSYNSFIRGTLEDDIHNAYIKPPSFSLMSHAEEVDYLARFNEKRSYFEDKIRDASSCIHSGIDKRSYNLHCNNSYGTLENKVLQCCDRLENCVNKHELSLDCDDFKNRRSRTIFKTNGNRRGGFSDTGSINSPSQYLQKLLDLRRDIVSVTRNDESSHSFHGFL